MVLASSNLLYTMECCLPDNCCVTWYALRWSASSYPRSAHRILKNTCEPSWTRRWSRCGPRAGCRPGGELH